MARSLTALVGQAQMALGWTQGELGRQLGFSLRTASRVVLGRSQLVPMHVRTLAEHVYRVDRGLAAELMATQGQTLIDAGIEAPPAPPPQNALPPSTVLRQQIDLVLCAVAEAADASPKALRPTVLLALRRALEVGLDLEAASKAGLLAPSDTPHSS